MLLNLFVCLLLGAGLSICHCDNIAYGTENSGDKLLFDKVLFAKNVPHPKNYTLIFKYIGSEISPNISHANFEVFNTTSDGVIEVNAEKGKEKTLIATINIINGTNIRVKGRIYGPSVSLLDASALQRVATLGANTNKPKTMTVVYGHNSTRTRNRKVNLGLRQNGDKLIAFQMKNVTFAYRFAETEFEFHDNSKYITSLGFSFDSPTAIAFINSTFVGEHQINAIAYDLNSPYFVANMSVYGYDDFDKPSTYVPIIAAQRNRF